MTVATATVVLIGLVIVGVVVETIHRRAVDAVAEALTVRTIVDARHVAAELAPELRAGQPGPKLDALLASAMGQRPDVAGITVVRPDGAIVGRRGAALSPAITARLTRAGASTREGHTTTAGSCGRCHDFDAQEGGGVVLASSAITAGGAKVGHVLVESHDFRAQALRSGSRLAYLLAYLLVLALVVTGAFLAGKRICAPLGRIAEVARHVAAGDLDQRQLPITSRDEIGELATAFNSMTANLSALGAAADRVAAGDLSGAMKAEGPVAAAFTRMIEGQRVLVRKIAETSVQLGSAAAEIYAAAQEQEAAAAQQAAGVEEVSHSMDSLLGSAAHIADSANGVLTNAERNRSTTDLTSGRIAELSAHTSRMGELLEAIREIADRSDLLALNASLEATRAGEAGRAFALVAGEMRRLAERVTGSVQGVKSLVADVRSFGSSTVMAMDEVRKLAESTTGSARQITLVTQQQRTATEQISQSMRAIASVLGQSATAAQETRESAEVLKTQAEHLTAVVSAFHVDGPAAG
jgi:methyl-accepting chemotaxis protein